MTTDELSTPLGQETKVRKRWRLPFTGTQVLTAGLGLFLAAFAGFALFHHDPLGGEPIARVALDPLGADGNAAIKSPAATVNAGKPATSAAQSPAAATGDLMAA